MSATDSLLDGPAATIAAAVRARAVTVAALVEASLARIAATDPALNAFVQVCADRARQRAGELDAQLLDRHATAALLPLVGVPFAVSNTIDVAGLATRAGAALEQERAPARRDAPVVARLEEAGGVLIGATNVDALGSGATTESSCDGPTRNPHDLARTPGGASGGAAAALAGGQLALSLASDTTGGLRVPASLCGVFGLKPTYGRLPRNGCYPFAPGLDHVGVLARHAGDVALAYDAVQGHDARDPACAVRAPEPTHASVSARIETLRIAVLGGAFESLAGAEARAAVALAAEALDVRRTVELSGTTRANAAAGLVVLAESAALHLANLRSRAGAYPAGVRERLIAGAMLPAAWVQQAQRMRRWHALRASELLREYDILLAPATPCVAPLLGTASLTLDGVEQRTDAALSALAQPLSFIGLPVAVAPVWGCHPALPVGVQVIGAPWREDLVLRVVHHLQSSGIAHAPVASVSEAALRAALRA
jgi:amidase/aspartyl-tRNA(Asn)/glutamyl-tRNA(Gln) amidotransferase subunit A